MPLAIAPYNVFVFQTYVRFPVGKIDKPPQIVWLCSWWHMLNFRHAQLPTRLASGRDLFLYG